MKIVQFTWRRFPVILLVLLLIGSISCMVGSSLPATQIPLTGEAPPSIPTGIQPTPTNLPAPTDQQLTPTDLPVPTDQQPTPTDLPLTAPGTAPSVAGCNIFPADNIWNTPVDGLPVDPLSEAYINSIGATENLQPDFGAGTWEGLPIGIPYNIVSGTQAKVTVDFDYPDESDPGPYPIPTNPLIEGGSDHHILIIDKDQCMLYELFDASHDTQGWHAGSGAIFPLDSNALRPDGWTSADAAGLPILPGLIRYDEVASGEITHALRFTVSQSQASYVWPARHKASSLTEAQYPPMGQRFRLKADYDISRFAPETQVILRALKKYGMLLADNGSDWYISGAPDERWNNDVLVSEFRSIPGSAFEAVQGASLMVSPDSAQAIRPTHQK